MCKMTQNEFMRYKAPQVQEKSEGILYEKLSARFGIVILQMDEL